MKKIAQISLIMFMSSALGNYSSSLRNCSFTPVDDGWIKVSREQLKSALRKPATFKNDIMPLTVTIDDGLGIKYICQQMDKVKPRLTDTQEKRNSFIARAYGHFASISSWKELYEKPTQDLLPKTSKTRFDDGKNTIAIVSRHIKETEQKDDNNGHTDALDQSSLGVLLPHKPIDKRKEAGYKVLQPHKTSSIPSAENGTPSILSNLIGWMIRA